MKLKQIFKKYKYSILFTLYLTFIVLTNTISGVLDFTLMSCAIAYYVHREGVGNIKNKKEWDASYKVLVWAAILFAIARLVFQYT